MLSVLFCLLLRKLRWLKTVSSTFKDLDFDEYFDFDLDFDEDFDFDFIN